MEVGATASPFAEMHAKELEALKLGIMAEIEAKLSQKEEQLWKRGQVEIKRLQQEQLQTKEYISKLQESQASLLSENKTIRGALVEVTSRFEVVVKEVSEVLRALPQCGVNVNTTSVATTLTGGEQVPQPSPSPSSASTAASDEGLLRKAIFEEPTPGGCSITAIAGSAERVGTWTATTNDLLVSPSLEVKEAGSTSQTFCTPPRNSLASQDVGFDGDSLDAWPQASPAVQLSLADSLPPAPASSPLPHPSPGTCKLLQLAECLDGNQAVQVATTAPPLPSSTPSSTNGLAKASTARQFDFITVQVVKEPGFQTLGAEVDHVDGVSLRVEGIDEHGLLGRHNAKQDGNAANCVQVGDRIIEVNGVRQDPIQMLNECKVRQRLSFTLARNVCHATSTRKAVSEIETSHEDHPSSEENTCKQAPIPPSPIDSRLRPEATVFVPSSQSMQEVQASPLVLPPVTVLPPGFEGFDTSGLLTLPTGTALGTQFASMLEAAGSTALASGAVCLPGAPPPPPFMQDEELKRALFQ